MDRPRCIPHERDCFVGAIVGVTVPSFAGLERRLHASEEDWGREIDCQIYRQFSPNVICQDRPPTIRFSFEFPPERCSRLRVNTMRHPVSGNRLQVSVFHIVTPAGNKDAHEFEQAR